MKGKKMKSCLAVIGFWVVLALVFGFINWFADLTSWFLGPLILAGAVVVLVSYAVRDFTNGGK